MPKNIQTHYGMYDYYKFFCKENPDINIDRKKYNKIISEFNKEVASHIIENLEYELPYRLGTIQILKQERKAYLNKEGKLINNIPIDWKATKDLWAKDEDAKKNKILIRHNNRHTNNFVFRLFYSKKKAKYKNKSVYFFRGVRSLTRAIAERINDYTKDKYDTYIKPKRTYAQR